MKTTMQNSRALIAVLAVVTALVAGGCSAQETQTGHKAGAVAQTVLGTAQDFAVLGASTVTSTGPTIVNGNLGVDPGSEVIGFPPGVVVGGTIHISDAVSLQAQNDTTVAYVTLAEQTPFVDLTDQDLGGMTLTPGVYRFSSSAQLTGTLTLNAGGDPDASFVFQIGTTLTTASNAVVQVENGAQDCNIYWQVGSSATLGTTTAFKGNIIALASITLNTGATVSGRAIARTGAVTLDGNDVSIEACAQPTVPEIDAGTPVGLDAGVDLPIDAAVDAAIDAAIDADCIDAEPLPVPECDASVDASCV